MKTSIQEMRGRCALIDGRSWMPNETGQVKKLKRHRSGVSPIIAEPGSEAGQPRFGPILSAKLVESRTARKRTVIAELVWALRAIGFTRDGESIISPFSAEVRHAAATSR